MVQPVHDASVRVEVVRNHIEELAVLMFEATPQGEGNEIGVLNQTTCPGISEVGNVGQIPGCPPPVSEVLEIVSQLLQPLFPGRPVEENEAPFGFLPSTQEVIKTAAYLLEGVLDEVLTAECGLLDGDPEEGPRTAKSPGGFQSLPDRSAAFRLGESTPPSPSSQHGASMKLQRLRRLRAKTFGQLVELEVEPMGLAFEERRATQDEVRITCIPGGPGFVQIKEVHERKQKRRPGENIVSTDRDKAALPNALGSLVATRTVVNDPAIGIAKARTR